MYRREASGQSRISGERPANTVPRGASVARQAQSRLTRGERQHKPVKTRLHPAAKLFMIGLVIPWVVPLAGVNLPVYRMVLMLTLIPSLVLWLRGRAGPIRAADIGVFVYCLWVAIALVAAQGVDTALQPSASFFIDGIGAYLLARCYVRTAEDFSQMVFFAVKLIAVLLPFALYEWLTGHVILLELFGKVFPTVEFANMPPRLGVFRVQGPFSHSILFGVFCGSIFALVGSADFPKRFMFGRGAVFLVIGSTLLSMSSAPIAGVAFQAVLLLWCKALGRFSWQWKLLWALALASYLVIALGSNQTPIQFYISHFTFDRQTGWYRLLIWDYGSASVMNHPLLGIGMGDWVRPAWMASTTVDNFWLLTAMRYGLPALFLLCISWLSIWVALARKRGLALELQPYRRSYLICMATFVFVGSTVHFWAAIYTWFFFLAGSGVWLLDAKTTAETATRALRGATVKRALRPEADPRRSARPAQAAE
jgi:hypothetical protein